MAFSDLSTSLQNVYLVNFEMAVKAIILVSFIYFCYWFIKDYNDCEKSNFLIIKWVRGLIYFACYPVLFLSPLFIFFMYPQYPLDNMLIILTSLYASLFSILVLIALVNVPFYGIEFGYELLGLKKKKDTMHYKLEKKMGLHNK